jgi:hypothetical protein
VQKQKYLTPEQLSERWHGSPTVGTLNNWAAQEVGPKRHIKRPGSGPDNRRVGTSYYTLEEVEDYERA